MFARAKVFLMAVMMIPLPGLSPKGYQGAGSKGLEKQPIARVGSGFNQILRSTLDSEAMFVTRI